MMIRRINFLIGLLVAFLASTHGFTGVQPFGNKGTSTEEEKKVDMGRLHVGTLSVAANFLFSIANLTVFFFNFPQWLPILAQSLPSTSRSMWVMANLSKVPYDVSSVKSINRDT
jgi:hypothetical protein